VRGTSPLRNPQLIAAEQLPEEPPWAEFAMEVEELELGAPRLRRASGLLLLRSGVQESASTKLPAVADLGCPRQRLAGEGGVAVDELCDWRCFAPWTLTEQGDAVAVEESDQLSVRSRNSKSSAG
jgi:hypothetical protein